MEASCCRHEGRRTSNQQCGRGKALSAVRLYNVGSFAHIAAAEFIHDIVTKYVLQTDLAMRWRFASGVKLAVMPHTELPVFVAMLVFLLALYTPTCQQWLCPLAQLLRLLLQRSLVLLCSPRF